MADKSPKVSIIIPHWNGIETLSECLESLQKSSYPSYEVIVVDNYSTDGSQDWIKKNHPNINLVENNNNYGYAGGCNRGADTALGDYLLFLNNDTTQSPDWLAPLVNLFEKDSSIAAAQPKILNYYKNNIFDYAGGSGGYMDIFCFPFARGRIFLTQEEDHQQYDDSRECFWASGTSIMVRKNLFLQAGKFDEVFFSHMEEIDLCWRLQAMGYSIWVEPKSVVYHKNAVSLPMHTHKKYYLNHRNSLLMLFSNFSIPTAFYVGIMRLMLEFIAIGYSVVKLDLNHISGILRSLIWILFHPLTIIRKRFQFKKIRIRKDKEIIKKMSNRSIVLEHYLGGKKTYLEIESNSA